MLFGTVFAENGTVDFEAGYRGCQACACQPRKTPPGNAVRGFANISRFLSVGSFYINLPENLRRSKELRISENLTTTLPGLAGASRACGCPASCPLDPAFAGSVFVEATRETESAAPFFGVFQPFSNPLESKRFRVSNETRAKGDPMQARRSGLHGEKEETRSTAEEKAAAF